MAFVNVATPFAVSTQTGKGEWHSASCYHGVLKIISHDRLGHGGRREEDDDER